MQDMEYQISSRTIEAMIRMQEDAERVRERFLRDMPKIIAARERAVEQIVQSLPTVQRAVERIAQTMSSPIFHKMRDQQLSAILAIHNPSATEAEPTVVTEEIEIQVAEPKVLEGIICLPEDAELLDKKIAIEVREKEVWLHFRVQTGWVRERITPQTYRIIQYLRDQAHYPQKRRFRITDLAKELSRATTRAVRIRSIANRLNELHILCETHGAKPIIAKEAKQYRYNPELKSS